MMDPRIDDLRALLRDDPGSRRFFQLGEFLRKENELAEAESVLRSGLEHHPRYVAAWVALGRIEFANSRWSEAEKCYAHALELDPENTVAARLIGETAEEQRRWERALKAYQLARMLSGGDPELEEKIAALERRLAGDDAYDAPTVPDLPVPPAFEPPPAEEEYGEDEVEILLEEEEVFAVRPEELPPPAPPATVRSREVFEFSNDDPFALRPTGNTGVWAIGADVFSSLVPEPEPELGDGEDAVFGPADALSDGAAAGVALDAEALPGPEVPGDADVDLAAEVAGDEHPGFFDDDASLVDDVAGLEAAAVDVLSREAELAAEPPAPPSTADAGVEDGVEPFDDVPLPTLTLARLAVAQDDVDLARRTLRSLLRRNPGDPGALRMLADLELESAGTAGARPALETEVQASVAAAKVTVLRGWMDAIRLAAERRTP